MSNEHIFSSEQTRRMASEAVLRHRVRDLEAETARQQDVIRTLRTQNNRLNDRLQQLQTDLVRLGNCHTYTSSRLLAELERSFNREDEAYLRELPQAIPIDDGVLGDPSELPQAVIATIDPAKKPTRVAPEEFSPGGPDIEHTDPDW